MGRLIDWVAPRGPTDAAVKFVTLVLLIVLLNGLFTILRGVQLTWGNDLAAPIVVAAPFVALAMALMAHQRRLERQLAVLASTDMLTGLPNRRAFLALATPAGPGTERKGPAGALLLLDADHFKRINDRHGHAVGDACLAAIADTLRATLRPGDAVGRMGGEEFSVFLPGASREEAARIGERLCRDIAVEAAGIEGRLSVTLSIGAALGSGAEPLDRLMARADDALYRAKAGGRARMAFWDEPPRSEAA
jgi:diguanylate cyclase